jgi:hypothetical protein
MSNRATEATLAMGNGHWVQIILKLIFKNYRIRKLEPNTAGR